MQIFKIFSILVMIYSVIQGIIWLAHGEIVKGVVILVCAPILYVVYLIVRSLLRKKEEKIVLYHRSRSPIPADFTQPQKERYHRQTDCANGNTISAICKYIYEHDRYREAREKGEMLTTYTSKRSRILAEKAQKKEKRKRLDDLFRQLEENNAGYRELSYC